MSIHKEKGGKEEFDEVRASLDLFTIIVSIQEKINETLTHRIEWLEDEIAALKEKSRKEE